MARRAQSHTAGPVCIAVALLTLAAVGQLFDSVALLRVGGLAVTFPFLLFPMAAAVAALSPRYPTYVGIVCLWVLLNAWQLLSALLLQATCHADWWRSEALFAFLSTCFVFTARLQIRERHLAGVTRMLLVAVVLFGGLGILQFGLLNWLQVKATVPAPWAVSGWDPALDVVRSGGLQRAAGIAREPSTYALGLSLALVLLFFLDAVQPCSNRVLFTTALATGIVGNILSLSIAGWAVAAAPVLVALLVGRLRLRWKRWLLVLLVLFGYLSYWQGWLLHVSGRMRAIVTGADRSTNLRVLSGLHLLVAPSDGLDDWLLGSGIGMEGVYADKVRAIYRAYGYHGTDVFNILAYVRLSQGLIGVALHILLLLAVFRPHGMKDWRLYAPLATAAMLYQFATGSYLSPAYWAFLAIMAVLRTANLQSREALTREGAGVHRPVPCL